MSADLFSLLLGVLAVVLVFVVAAAKSAGSW